MNTHPSHDPDLNLELVPEIEDEGMSHDWPSGNYRGREMQCMNIINNLVIQDSII